MNWQDSPIKIHTGPRESIEFYAEEQTIINTAILSITYDPGKAVPQHDTLGKKYSAAQTKQTKFKIEYDHGESFILEGWEEAEEHTGKDRKMLGKLFKALSREGKPSALHFKDIDGLRYKITLLNSNVEVIYFPVKQESL